MLPSRFLLSSGMLPCAASGMPLLFLKGKSIPRLFQPDSCSHRGSEDGLSHHTSSYRVPLVPALSLRGTWFVLRVSQSPQSCPPTSCPGGTEHLLGAPHRPCSAPNVIYRR